MSSVVQAIPDVEVFLSLEPEELGAKLLFLIRRGLRHDGDLFHKNDLMRSLWEPQQEAYPKDQQSAVELALSEAWAWLEAQALILPASGSNGIHGFRVLSRRARRFEHEAEFANYAIARMLRRENLHPKISEKVWSAFMRGEFDVAAFQAMKAVEVCVREASGFGNSVLGVALMREAFAPEKGALTDTGTERGEQVARMELFAGAIGSYKNPHSHRDVNLNDPAEAVEIIMLANHLLRIVDARIIAKNPQSL
ncbi:MAG: TIGR02391 family protein [Bryobacteraceae bacterium]